MSKEKKLNITVLFLLFLEILITKYFCSLTNLLNFQSLFWFLHLILTLVFIAFTHYFLKKDIGYYDIFLIFFPIIGVLILFLECSLQNWKISDAVVFEAFSSMTDVSLLKEEKKFMKEEFEVMSSFDLLLSDNIVEKKKFLFSFQTKDISLKVNILQRALLDENIDVIHYAATELNKLENELQDNINMKENGKNKLELYNAYKKYIQSGLLMDSILEFYLNKAFSLLESLEKNEIEKEEEYLSLQQYKKI